MPKNNLKLNNKNSSKSSARKSFVWHPLKFKVQNSKFKISVQNLKNWKFVSLAALALIIGGTVVYFSFLPQNARSKTFTMFQGAWNV